MKREFIVETLADTEQAGSVIASELRFPACVYLYGDMGAGKTTLTKALLQGLGYQGAVTSPTYNLIQEYSTPKGMVFHMDLYRLDDPSEIEFLALEDLWSEQCLFLIEWPQRGAGYIRSADANISLKKVDHAGVDKREITLQIGNAD